MPAALWPRASLLRRSLFWKILLAFWLTLLLAGVAPGWWCGGIFPIPGQLDHDHRRHRRDLTVQPISMINTVSGFARPFLSPLQTIHQHPALPCCRFHWIVKTVRNQLGPENPDHHRVPGVSNGPYMWGLIEPQNIHSA